MKRSKSPGPSGIIADILKAAGEEVVELARQQIDCFHAWYDSSRLEVELHFEPLQGQGWRPWQLLWHEAHRQGHESARMDARLLHLQDICKMMNIGEMHFDSMPGRGTIDVIFNVHQLQKKYITGNKRLYFVFVDLEKTGDHVPKKVLLWALRSLSVEEWTIHVIWSMYFNACCVWVSALEASLHWRLCAHRRHPGGRYLQAQGVEGWQWE